MSEWVLQLHLSTFLRVPFCMFFPSPKAFPTVTSPHYALGHILHPFPNWNGSPGKVETLSISERALEAGVNQKWHCLEGGPWRQGSKEMKMKQGKKLRVKTQIKQTMYLLRWHKRTYMKGDQKDWTQSMRPDIPMSNPPSLVTCYPPFMQKFTKEA